MLRPSDTSNKLLSVADHIDRDNGLCFVSFLLHEKSQTGGVNLARDDGALQDSSRVVRL